MNPLTKSEMCQRLRSRRHELGMTLEDCGARLGQTRQAWSAVESGEGELVSWDRLARMAEAVDLEFRGVLLER